MTPDFQTVLDEVFSELIEVIDRAARKSMDELRVELTQILDRATRLLEVHKEWKYCKYALVAWVDSEIIVQHPHWQENPLESKYFGTGNAYTEFFKQAQRSYENKYFNAYEVFFICFMFGFRGVYQSRDRTEVPKALPPTDTQWQEQVSRRLKRIKREASSGWDETRSFDIGKQALKGFGSFVNNLLVFALLPIMALIYFLFFRN